MATVQVFISVSKEVIAREGTKMLSKTMMIVTLSLSYAAQAHDYGDDATVADSTDKRLQEVGAKLDNVLAQEAPEEHAVDAQATWYGTKFTGCFCKQVHRSNKKCYKGHSRYTGQTSCSGSYKYAENSYDYCKNPRSCSRYTHSTCYDKTYGLFPEWGCPA